MMELTSHKRNRGRPRKNISFDGMGVKDALSDIKKGVRKSASTTKKGFNKTIVDSGVGKAIAKELIDVGADVLIPAGTTGLSMMLGDPTGVSGAVVGKVIGDQIQREAEKGGYGLKGKALTAQKNKMSDFFVKMGGLMPRHAKALTNKVFREGEKVLDMMEVPISGGKISLKGVRKDLIKGAKEIWREARPVLKYAGETALTMAEPLVESGIRTVAMSYGADPETADMSAKIFTSTAKEKAQQGLNRLSKKKSKSPQEYIDRASAIVQDKSQKYIEQAEKKGLNQIAKSGMSEEAKQLAMDKLREKTQQAQNVVDLNVEKVESQIQEAVSGRRRRGIQDTQQDMTGGMGLYSRNDMGTLLSPDSVAKTPFYVRPNIEQGQISGISGGSFYGASFRGASFRNLSGQGCMCGGGSFL